MKLNIDLEKAAIFEPKSLKFPDAWIGHMPFAAWLIDDFRPRVFVELGTHSGNSYFSFCQAVVELQLSTKCFSVDLWLGDEHSGSYSEEVFQVVNDWNRENYHSFSKLCRTDFNEAVNDFEDSSIDLLHIDGLHTYEAVKNDFETWLPKLAPGALVLFHDTQVKANGFGVHLFWNELISHYPNNLEFKHSNGLGVLQLNSSPENKIRPWLDRSFANDEKDFTKYFEKLGYRIGNKYKAQMEILGLTSANQELTSANQELTSANQELTSANQELTSANQELILTTKDLTSDTENNTQLALHLDEIAALRDQQKQLIERHSAIMASTSWKITKPLRDVKKFCITQKRLLKYGANVYRSKKGLFKFGIKAISILRNEGVTGFKQRYQWAIRDRNIEIHLNDQVKNYIPEFYTLSNKQKSRIIKEIADFEFTPKFSICVPVYNVELQWLEAFIQSVRSQLYTNWELCLADDCSTKTHVVEFLKRIEREDPRIKVVYRTSNGHIAVATNSALEISSGDYICLMDNDDEITPNALFEFARVLNNDCSVDMIYSDEDKIDIDGNHYEPFFKPDWSPEALEGCMYTAHFACYRSELVKQIGGFRSDYNGAQDYDFVLRFTEKAKNIIHIPKILYHWRAIPGSTAYSMDEKTYVITAAQNALLDRVKRVTGSEGVCKLGAYAGSFDLRYPILGEPLVSIVIPTAGKFAEINGRSVNLLENLIESIDRKSTYRNFEFIVVDNADLPAQTQLKLEKYNCRFVHFHGEFNVAKKMNLGAQIAGEYILFLNDDIEVITPDWLECMLQLIQRAGVGVVGAKLLYENSNIQHAGVTFWQGLPDHIRKGFGQADPGYFFSSVANRNYLAVTGAALLTKRDDFDAVGGFDEKFAINYNDIDYCLKVGDLGKRIVYAAGAELFHFESTSREPTVAQNEIDLFQRKWNNGTALDPYYSPYFDNHPPNFHLKVSGELTNLIKKS